MSRSPASRRPPHLHTPPLIGTYTLDQIYGGAGRPGTARKGRRGTTRRPLYGLRRIPAARRPQIHAAAPLLSSCTWQNRRWKRASPCRQPPAAIGPPVALPGCPHRSSVGALSAPPPCSPAASTLSSPPLPINSLSFSKSPPSLASPSLSVSASVSLSDLLRPNPPPPPHGGIVPTIEVVKHKPLSLSHKEAALHVEGAVLLFVLVHMYPLRTGY